MSAQLEGIPEPTLLQELHAEVLELLGPDAETLQLERAVLGIFFTGVKLSDGAGGICATPVKSVPEAVCCPSSARAIGSATVRRLPRLPRMAMLLMR